jgi:putative ABC transport system permease protein
MLHALTLAFRHLWRKKIYSFIILLSLTIGFSCANLMLSFLIAEANTDSFHVNIDRTFQLFSDDPFGGKNNLAYIPGSLTEYLVQNYPEAENVCQVSNMNGVALETEAGVFGDMMILSVDSSFFSFFSFPLSATANNIFTSSTIVLTREKAKILFGTEDVVGRLLTFKTSDTSRVVTVSGVVDEVPENSHLVFDALVHHSILTNKMGGGASYVLLNNAGQAKNLEANVNRDAARPTLVGPGKVNYFLKPLKGSYFQSANKMPYMKTRSEIFIPIGYVVCAIILFMASFNFISLFLLSLHGRKKETGIKKTLGISFNNLLQASIVEVVLYIIIAFAISVLFTYLLLPVFNTALSATLSFSYFSRLQVLLTIGCLVVLLGVIVVVTCVSQQWRVVPVSLMKNFSHNKVTFNTLLFTVQFIISITIAICASTIVRQMYYLEHEPLGFNRHIIQLQSPDKTLSSSLSVLKQNLLQIPDIGDVTVCSGNPISGNSIVRYDLSSGEYYTPFVFSGDADFMKTLNLTLIEGQPLAENVHGKLVNEKLVHEFNIVHPVGATIPGTEDKIIGVVKDFTCVSFKEVVPPVIISFESRAQRVLIDYDGKDLSALIPMIQVAWNKIFPGYIFTYQVIQQDLLKKYKSETFFYKIIVAFSIATVIVSCFGLFGLSWAVSQSRVKEIGIRKVLGATTNDVLKLLANTFLKRIVLAFLIAAPVGYFLMDKWLQNFVNRIPLDVWIFAVSALLVLITACATLSLQTIKAALTNPVDELRNE